MLSPLCCLFFIVGLFYGELTDVVVHSLLSQRGALEEADVVEWSGVVVGGRVGLASICHNVLHQFYSSHGCASIQLFDLLGVGVHKEVIQVVGSAGFVIVAQVGELVRGNLSPVWKIDSLLGVEWSVCVLLVDILDHWLIVVTTKVRIIVIDLHPGSTPSSP